MVIILSTSTYYSQICCVCIVSNPKLESNSLNQIPFRKVSDARCIQIYVFNQHRITSWKVFICDKRIGYGVPWERKFDGINVQFCWGGLGITLSLVIKNGKCNEWGRGCGVYSHQIHYFALLDKKASCRGMGSLWNRVIMVPNSLWSTDYWLQIYPS